MEALAKQMSYRGNVVIFKNSIQASLMFFFQLFYTVMKIAEIQ